MTNSPHAACGGKCLPRLEPRVTAVAPSASTQISKPKKQNNLFTVYIYILYTMLLHVYVYIYIYTCHDDIHIYMYIYQTKTWFFIPYSNTYTLKCVDKNMYYVSIHIIQYISNISTAACSWVPGYAGDLQPWVPSCSSWICLASGSSWIIIIT